MKIMHRVAGLILMLLSGQVSAYETADEMIDDKLRILSGSDESAQIEMLQRLQWSGLTDERLFDRIADIPETEYRNEEMNRSEYNLLSHRVRALGYSGNDKYRSLLEVIQAEAGYRRLRGHARKAQADLDRFQRWNQMLADSDFSVSGKSYEVATYMKMLHIDDPAVQRLAARATYDELQQDADLLDRIAANLKAVYLQEGLSAEAQDTAAWYIKALYRNALGKNQELLQVVAQNTPYKKIRKYALKYSQ